MRTNGARLLAITIGVFNFGDPGSERERILNWLKPDGIVVQTDRLNKLRKDCQENNTGRWIRQDLFTPWFNDQDARSLWLHGPGEIFIIQGVIRNADHFRSWLW